VRVIYEKDIVDRLRAARTEAFSSGKEIEKVVIDLKEARALLKALPPMSLYPSGAWCDFELWLTEMEMLGVARRPMPISQVFGMKIEVEK
jgi:hypothetical protein